MRLQTIFWFLALILFITPGAIIAQDDAGDAADPGEYTGDIEELENLEDDGFLQALPVEKLNELRFYVGEYVEIYGITAERRDDIAGTTYVYKLVDDYNGVVWIRSNEEWPERGLHYRIWGTVIQEDSEIVIIEAEREYDPPEIAKNEEDEKDDQEEDPVQNEELSTVTIIGWLVAAAALVIALYLLFAPKRKNPQSLVTTSTQTIAAVARTQPISRPSAPASSLRPQAKTTRLWGQIHIVDGLSKGKMFPMTANEIKIGRNFDMDIQLQDESNVVSTEHAVIKVTIDQKLVFIDKSTNGSKVNGERVHNTEVDLPLDAELTIGPYKLRLSDVEVPSKSASPGGTVILGEKSKPSAVTLQYMGIDLEVTGGDYDVGTTYQIKGYVTKIGRGSDQDLVLSDPFISNEHAVIRFEDEKWKIENVSSSKQGTLVNGNQVTEPVEITAGDRITLGTTVVEFKTCSSFKNPT